MVAADVMTEEVTVVKPDMPLDELVELFALNRISGAPVVNDDGKLIGVVSISDVAHAVNHRAPRGRWADFSRDIWPEDLLEELGSVDLRLQVADLMNETTFDVIASTPLEHVVDTILHLRVHRVIVVDKQRRVQGLITTFDLVRLLPTLLAEKTRS